MPSSHGPCRTPSAAAVAGSLAIVAGLFTLPLAVQQRPDSTRYDTTGVLRTIEVRGSATGVGQVRAGNAITALAYFRAAQGARRDLFAYLSADFQLGTARS
jgi:hypothetical protein